jgi:hypothetical protein
MNRALLPDLPSTIAPSPRSLECLSVVPYAIPHFGPLCFQSFAHSSAIRWGWGVATGFSFSNFEFRSRSTLSSLFSHSSNSFAFTQVSTLLFSSNSELFRKNTGGYGVAFSLPRYFLAPLLPPFPEWNVALAFPATPPKTSVEWNVAQRGSPPRSACDPPPHLSQ